MIFREATIEDIEQIQIVRNSVKENTLSNPDLVTDKDCEEYITLRGRGWVCEINSEIVGFSIVDIRENNVWALFLKPEFEKKGIGKKLHDMMIDWYFDQTTQSLWLSTSPETRASEFYRKAGWVDIGKLENGEVKFEMTFEIWKQVAI